jgi:hypothetical protein
MGHYDHNDAYETNWVGPEEFGNPWGADIDVNHADNGDDPGRPVYRVRALPTDIELTWAEFEPYGDQVRGDSPSYVADYRQAIQSAATQKFRSERQWGREL